MNTLAEADGFVVRLWVGVEFVTRDGSTRWGLDFCGTRQIVQTAVLPSLVPQFVSLPMMQLAWGCGFAGDHLAARAW